MPRPPLLKFLDHTQTHINTGEFFSMSDRLDAEAATYTTQNIKKRQTSMRSEDFETAIPVKDRPQTNDFDGTATGIGRNNYSPVAVRMIYLRISILTL
jgi:hypothetical protein